MMYDAIYGYQLNFRLVSFLNVVSIKKAWCLLLFLFVYLLAPSQSNSINFDHFTTKQGLPSEQIYHSFQDKDGFLWIGTDVGVSRFDGKVFKNYNVNDGLGDNEIHEIYQDTHGRIWFIPFSGKLTYFYNDTIYTQNTDVIDLEPMKGHLNQANISEDAIGNIYICKGARKKIIKLTVKDNKTTVIDLSQYLSPDEGFAAFFKNSKKQFFCITNKQKIIELGENNLNKVVSNSFLLKVVPPFFCYNTHKTQGDILFLSNKDGIYSIEDTTVKLCISTKELSLNKKLEIIHIVPDGKNNLWVNDLNHNTLLFKVLNGKYYNSLSVLSDKFAVVTIDTEENIWFATNNGLYKTTDSKLQDNFIFNINRQLYSQKVISCAVDKDSGLWLGYSNGFISRMSTKQVLHLNLNVERNGNNRILQIKVDSFGNIFVLSDENLSFIERLKNGKYSKPVAAKQSDGSPLLNNSFKKNIFNSKGECFLLGAFDDVVYQFNSSTKRVNNSVSTVRKKVSVSLVLFLIQKVDSIRVG